MFEIKNVVIPDPQIFFCIPASAANSLAVNLNGVKTLLATGLGTVSLTVNQLL